MAKGDITQKDLLVFIDTLLERLVIIGDKTQNEVDALKMATAAFNNHKTEPFWKKLAISLIFIILTVGALMALGRVFYYCGMSVTTEGGGLQRCESKAQLR